MNLSGHKGFIPFLHSGYVERNSYYLCCHCRRKRVNVVKLYDFQFRAAQFMIVGPPYYNNAK